MGYRNLSIAIMCTMLVACGAGSGSSGNDSAANVGPARPECIAPSRPGGGFDLTCKLAQKGLMDLKLLPGPMRVTYQPGGIGAVSFNTIIAQRGSDKDVIVAFSGGSLLNIAQGKFGRYTEEDVRWVAAVGLDYGMLAVRSDSPYHTLGDLIDALQKDPTAVVFGAGGTVGSQDWMKSALIAQAAGIDYRAIRYVPFEGGGEAQTALLGGHIQAYSGDISEIRGMHESKKLRVLAVMSDERLAAPYATVPTAKEQGYDFTWPIMRGFYVGPDVSDVDYNWWVNNFATMMADPRFDEMRRELGMFPYSKTGAALERVIQERMQIYRDLADSFGLNIAAAESSGN